MLFICHVQVTKGLTCGGIFKQTFELEWLAWKHLPTASLTAESCPFFFVHTYFPLLALRATLCPRHSMSNIVLTSLGRKTWMSWKLRDREKTWTKIAILKLKELLTLPWQWTGSLRETLESSRIHRWSWTWTFCCPCQSPSGRSPCLSPHPDLLKYSPLVKQKEKTALVIAPSFSRNYRLQCCMLLNAICLPLNVIYSLRHCQGDLYA